MIVLAISFMNTNCGCTPVVRTIGHITDHHLRSFVNIGPGEERTAPLTHRLDRMKCSCQLATTPMVYVALSTNWFSRKPRC